MATKTLNTVYEIGNAGKTVELEVKAGAIGQTSRMKISLEGKTIIEKHAGNFPKTGLGQDTLLHGKKLRIIATIADTSRQTNLTSLEITLTGGKAAATYPLKQTVSREGDSADYLCFIEFFDVNAPT